MMAFKGFTPDLKSVMGDGKKETCHFVPGETKKVERSKTANSGFHCCEYPPDCLRYYSWPKSRFFRVEATGDIDEDDQNRIASTEITLVQELDAQLFAFYTMRYIIMHPRRYDWKVSEEGVTVKLDEAEAFTSEHIAIARGSNPRVRGTEGSVLGLLVESKKGIVVSKLILVTKELAGKWIMIDKDRQLHLLVENKDGIQLHMED